MATIDLMDYYRLRFQIEFNFRNAKPFWGLEDFMSVKPTPVTNAANLAFFMVSLSHTLLKTLRLNQPDASILDLKAYAHDYRYVTELIDLLPQKTTPGFWTQALNRFANLGHIHPAPSHPNPA